MFFGGQFVSNVGNSITDFALPLLVYQLTGSELGLGLAFAIRMVPYLLFGLAIGAWGDRLDRKKLMVASDLANAALLLPRRSTASSTRMNSRRPTAGRGRATRRAASSGRPSSVCCSGSESASKSSC